jgi:hypothetical protein
VLPVYVTQLEAGLILVEMVRRQLSCWRMCLRISDGREVKVARDQELMRRV